MQWIILKIYIFIVLINKHIIVFVLCLYLMQLIVNPGLLGCQHFLYADNTIFNFCNTYCTDKQCCNVSYKHKHNSNSNHIHIHIFTIIVRPLEAVRKQCAMWSDFGCLLSRHSSIFPASCNNISFNIAQHNTTLHSTKKQRWVEQVQRRQLQTEEYVHILVLTDVHPRMQCISVLCLIFIDTSL